VSDFLEQMRELSLERVAEARKPGREAELRDRVAVAAAARPIPTERFGIIAELKSVSPAEGDLGDSLPPAERARQYAAGGAVALSVLTEQSRFGGSLNDLAVVASSVDLPVMRKDFLVDPWQLLEARAHGASGVLLIAELLDDAMLDEMLGVALELDLFVLLESFSLEQTMRVLPLCDGQRVLCGVNCRDLRSLGIDLERFTDAGERLAGQVWVAESGIASVVDLARALDTGCRLVLCGTALMRAEDPAAVLREFTRIGRGHR
jgi:indole-3-glycerol phosphate synthase